MNLDFSRVSLDEYNQIITLMVSNIALEHLETKGKAKIVERLDELLKPAPKTITIQGIINICAEAWTDDGDYHDNEMHIEIEHHDWTENSTSFKIFKSKPSGAYSSKTPDLGFYVSSNKILIPRAENIRWPSNSGYGVECSIYQMFCSGTEITDAHTVSEYDLSLIHI